MNRRSVLRACVGLWMMAGGQAAIASSDSAPAESEARPRLLVLVVVDQMSDDLLDRYGPHLRGGFRRLLDEGRRFDNAVVDHAPTNSLPGHLTVATGAHPRRHGIIDNNWIEMQSGRPVQVLGFSDPNCPVNAVRGTPRGPAGSEAGMGPGRFEAPTIVEWVLAAHPRARFASVGTGGGVSVLHAGKAKGPVLWYDGASGGYVTSGCYAAGLPDWALSVNARLDAEHLADDWTLAAPASIVRLAGRDDAPHEHGGSDYVFPHRRPDDPAERRRWFLSTPFADRATLALAKAAIAGEGLGRDAVTDILTIGLSTLDHVGHSYGPTSVEQADTLYRMDRDLGDFLQFLDEKVGRGRWAMAVSADHGAPPAPEEAARLGIAGARRVSAQEASRATDAIVAAAEQVEGPAKRRAAAAAAAGGIDFIARVITPESIDRPNPGDPILGLYANSYRPGRTSVHPLYNSESERSVAEFGIVVVPHPYTVVDWAASIHGSPWAYDREVEMIFYGPGVTPGATPNPARTVDVAPTLAKLARIEPLSAIDGKVLDLAGSASAPSGK